VTTRCQVALEPAYILHHYPYRDSSLLLEVFSRRHGRLGLVARGARSARGRWRGQLQGFIPLLLSWSQRGELGTLTGVEARGGTVAFAGRQLLSAYYLNELLLRLLARHDPHPELFDAYERALQELAVREEAALRVFEKRLLEALGYGLLLDRTADSGLAVEPEATYGYQLERGPVRCDNPADSRLYLRGSSLLALHREALDDPRTARDARGLLRAALSIYLGSRPLRTREVSRRLSTFTAAGGGPPARMRPADGSEEEHGN
jgi:DNA repair protein RecO (recombination protein O)